MLRWWLGIGIPVLLLLCSGLAAQPAGVPPCQMVAKQLQLKQGTLPDFTGCNFVDARGALNNAGFNPVERIERSPINWPSYVVSHQDHDGLEVYLYHVAGSIEVPPVPTPVRVSIAAPNQAEEGSTFDLTIRRDRNDGKVLTVTLDYQPAELLVQPPASYLFTDAANEVTIPLKTASGVAGDGDHPLLISLGSVSEGAAIGKPARLQVNITDRPPAQRFTVAVDGKLIRGQSLPFVVRRTDTTDPANPQYDVLQDGVARLTGQKTAFGDGETQWPLKVGTEGYDACGGPVTIVLHALGGDVTQNENLTGDLPANCAIKPTGDGGGGRDDGDPDWWWPWIIPVILVGTAAIYALHKWPWWPRPRAACSFAVPTISAVTLGERALLWPGASARARIEPGDIRTPDPLPMETDDHG